MTVLTIDNPEDLQQMAEAVEYLREMTMTVIRSIIRRCERDTSYPFIDTKFSLLDGKDFPDDDPIRGKRTIYSWIQGRGLEAFVAHADWFAAMGGEYKEDVERLKNIISRVFYRVEDIRMSNNGRLFFMMTDAGKPCRLNSVGEVEEFEFDGSTGPNYSDLFYSKGMVAAADMLDDEDKKCKACEWFDRICEEIFEDKFQSDQQPLDPENPGACQIPGRIPQGPYMIAIGGV